MKLLREITDINFKSLNCELLIISLIPLTLLFKENLNTISILVFIGYWLFTKKFNKTNLNSKPLTWLVRSSVLYLSLIFLWTVFSVNPLEGLKATGDKLFLVVIPILFSYKKFTKEEFKFINKVFIIGILIVSFYCYVNVIINAIGSGGFSINSSENKNWTYYLFLNARLSPDIHPVYFTLYCFYAICSIFFELKEVNKKNKSIYYLLISYLIVFIILLNARAPIFFALIIGVGFLVSNILRKRRLRDFLICIFTIISVLIFAFVFKDSIFKRSTVFFNQLNEDPLKIANIHNSQGKRMQLLLLSKKTIKEHPFLGVGTENREYYFIYYYNKFFKDKFKLAVKNYNAHNQYIESLIGRGIFGLISLLLMILVPIKFSKKHFNQYFVFFVLFALSLLTENLLDRQRGIILFIFFATTIANHIQAINEGKYIEGIRE